VLRERPDRRGDLPELSRRRGRDVHVLGKLDAHRPAHRLRAAAGDERAAHGRLK
jgi:hypothetical protein